MVQKVIWSDNAITSFGNACNYLLEKFSRTELEKFEAKIEFKLFSIRSNPRLGKRVNNRPNTYSTVINKRIVLYYHTDRQRKQLFSYRFGIRCKIPED